MSGRDDPFAEFKYWLVHLPAYDTPEWDWPSAREKDRSLSKVQREIVGRNATIFEDKTAWFATMDRFTLALDTISDADLREKTRRRFRFHLDRHNFGDGDRDFSFYNFPVSVSFIGSRFGSGKVDFSNSSIVCKEIDFSNVRFDDGGLDFVGSEITNAKVIFDGAQFGAGDIRFDMLTAKGASFSFTKTNLKTGHLRFDHNAGEIDRLDLYRFVAEHGLVSVSFSNIKQVSLHTAAIGGSVFVIGSQIGFLNCQRLSSTDVVDLTGSTFDTVPDFRNTKLDRAPEVARMKVPEPELAQVVRGINPVNGEETKRSDLFARAVDGDDVLKLRKLKAMAIAANDHEKDGEFFAYEMMAKRGVEHTTFWQLLFNTIYWKVSFYGQSYLRPLGWLAASYLGFATHYVWWLQRYVPAPDAAHFAWWFSLKNTIPFLGSLFRFAPAPEGHVSRFDQVFAQAADTGLNVDAVIQTGVFQSVLGAVFLFFLLLGLRNKFRLK